VGPTFNVAKAQHHMGFVPAPYLRPSTNDRVDAGMGAKMVKHGFERIYWMKRPQWRQYRNHSCGFFRIYNGVSLEPCGCNIRRSLHASSKLGGMPA